VQARSKSGSVDTVPKGAPPTPQKGKAAPTAQKTQVKQAPGKAPPAKQGKKGKKNKHQQYDLIVTLDLVSTGRLG
jgi:hypothetical protein